MILWNGCQTVSLLWAYHRFSIFAKGSTDMLLADFLPAGVFAILFVFARIGAAILALPGFGEAFVPARVRLGLAILVSIIIVPLVSAKIPQAPTAPFQLLILLFAEMVIGALIGLSAKIAMLSLQTAGSFIAFMTSLANAFFSNPASAQQSSIYSSLLGVIGIVAIFVTDMHHLALEALVESYIIFPPGNGFPAGDFASVFSDVIAESLIIAMKLAGPYFIVGLVFYLGLGLLARLMPQIQVFFLAIPLQIMMGMAILIPSISMMMYIFLEYYESLLRGYML